MLFRQERMGSVTLQGPPSSLDSIGLGILVNIIWGTTFLASSVTLHAWSPTTASAIRFVIAIPCLYLVGRLMGARLQVPRGRHALLWLIFVAASAYGCLYPLQLGGLKKIPTSLSAIIMFTSPLFVLIASRVALGNRFSRTNVIAVGLGIVGGGVLLGPKLAALSEVTLNTNFALGAAQTMAAALLLGVSVVGTKALSRTMDPFSITFWSMSLGTLMLVAVAGFQDGWQLPRFDDSSAVVAVVYLATICSAVAFWVWNRAISNSSAQNVSMTMHVKTPVAVALGVSLGREPFGASVLLGLLIISFAVYLSSRT